MTGTVVAAVLWFLSIWAVPFFLRLAFIAGGVIGSVSGDKERIWPAWAGLIIGYVLGIAWVIFAIVQVILHIITVIQLASAGG